MRAPLSQACVPCSGETRKDVCARVHTFCGRNRKARKNGIQIQIVSIIILIVIDLLFPLSPISFYPTESFPTWNHSLSSSTESSPSRTSARMETSGEQAFETRCLASRHLLACAGNQNFGERVP